jgi:hypothetical protein
MSILACSVKGTHDVQARGLPQFPAMLDLKTGTELCCILSGITLAGISRDARRRRAGQRCERSHYRPSNPVKIRCLSVTQ